MEEELARFTPLVMATARRYTGRGAEFNDLAQEGYLALLELIPLCPAPERLPAYLKSRLPGRVRTAARRCWRCAEISAGSVEELEGTANEPRASQADPDGTMDLERLLTPEEMRVARMLADGYTQSEVATELGVTQQAVSRRVARMRERVRRDPSGAVHRSG
ncbi:MAG: sigma-70 family RNA polymerase sigma factor [Synergistaceae bacterium]|nr:sigma-70 family RNA polymerase sigma factor [Synergistota bacterium]NLM71404.1 sigma-70 family RNA polymerase sigma factor [Synergistaceae bacterium]